MKATCAYCLRSAEYYIITKPIHGELAAVCYAHKNRKS
jgi:hypothetical protein